MDLYSISRFQKGSPTPPFHLGGEFQRVDNRCFLANTLAAIELKGTEGLFDECAQGDLVMVRVQADLKGSIACDDVEIIHRTARERAPIRGDHAAEFVRFVNRVRWFFLELGLIEASTPTLVKCPGLEPALEPFRVEVNKGSSKRSAYLPTSPEIHLKKILAQGWTDIFEIKNCFRGGEFSAHHQPEFLMLEWYRGYADLRLVRQDLQALLEDLHDAGFISRGPQLNLTTWAELFQEMFQFKLTPKTSLDELRALAAAMNLQVGEDDSFNDVFHRILIDFIEPGMKAKGPLIVRDFPPSQAALARFTPDGWVDRFEFYWNGFEIANAFYEVTDPGEQRRRWQAEQDERTRMGTSAVPQDEALIQALERGMPPTGGIALGLERLYMACRKIDDIKRLKFFAAENLFESEV